MNIIAGVNQNVLEAFINIYMKNPQIEDKHSAMAEELGIDRTQAKLATYQLIYFHPSLRFLQGMGASQELFKIFSLEERKNLSKVELISFLEERDYLVDVSTESFRKGVHYTLNQARVDLETFKKNRADSNN
ncbi:hypothetical protein APT65_00091 [Trabzonvirus APT65]|uniref:Uncharacterized protein n=1 Tax=Aeromonas phage APT65 TaxID=2982914 RepID=A0A9E8K2D4_9CAUD|nr:hypothetical protein APT65_00091 [Aeromonas phage APT65]